MTLADAAVAHLLRRIQSDPRLAYYFDPLTRSMELLTAAHASANGVDVEQFRKEYYAQLRFEAPPDPEATPRPPDSASVLRMQPSGRWAICCPGRDPMEITSGEVFRVEVDGELKVTRMEFRHFSGPLKGREHRGQPGEYYSVDGYWLRDGLRAALGAGDD